MKTNAIVIAGYYGFGNAGDELILASLVEQIRRESPLCRITVFSRNPEDTRKRYVVEAVDRWQPWQWIGPLMKARRFMLGGGGLLQETTGPWNYVYYLGLVVLAKLLGCRTELRAIGVDAIKRGSNRLMTRIVFNYFVDHVSVRDSDSQRALEAAGVRRTIFRVADPVFQLPVRTPVPIEPRIALAAGPWAQRIGWDHDLALLCDRVQQELDVPVDLIAFYPDQDLPICRKVAQAAQSHPIVRVWENPEDLLEWIPSYTLVMGMRFHALAIAALHERPFIGWGFQKKVHSLCRDFGQPLWTFERGWDEESVFRQIKESWKHRETLSHRYRPLLEELKSPAQIAKDVLKIHPALI